MPPARPGRISARLSFATRGRDDRRSRSRRFGARAGDDARSGCVSQWHEELWIVVPRCAHQCRLWRQGDRHQPHAADQESGALHRRPLGRQVHEDMHLPKGSHRRGQRHDRRILFAPLRTGRLPRPCRAGQYPCAPVRWPQRALRSGGGVMKLPATPSFRLDGKRALVTGAGRGIGLTAAAALAEAGAHVTLAARTTSEIEEAAAAIRARGQQAEALTLDVTDNKAVQAALKGKVFDVLVNNAGTNRPGPFLEVTEESYDLIFDLDMRACFFVAQAVVRELVAAKRKGSIINITSQLGHVGWAGRTIYVSAKHALEGFTKALGVELAPIGIRVNSIAPTFIETPMTKPFF